MIDISLYTTTINIDPITLSSKHPEPILDSPQSLDYTRHLSSSVTE